MIVITGDVHTKLLLHGDSFLDGSRDKRVITNTGVAVSTAQSKFGDSSFYFNGSAYLTIPGYDFGTDDFTIDWWEYPTNANAGTRFTNVYCTSYATQAGGILLYVNEDSLRLYLSNKTGGAAINDWNVLSYQPLGNNVVNTWTHRAVVRSGSSLMFFKNGLLEYTYAIGTNKIGYSLDRPWGIGNWASDLMTTGYPYIGYIDEFRVSDIARWTESFTPPTEPYPSGNIEILPGGVIPQNYALRRRMMVAGGGSAPISDLPLGTLINVGTDGGNGAANYEIADINNFVSGGVVLVRKDIHSQSVYGSKYAYYNGSTLDHRMTSIYNSYPEKLKNEIMDATFYLYKNGDISRKVFALSYTMVGFGQNNGFTEGKALQLYKSNANRIKTYNGSANYWWLSSRAYDDRLYYVGRNGSNMGAARDDENYGVVPAFVIPGDMLYNATPNTDGSYNLIL